MINPPDSEMGSAKQLQRALPRTKLNMICYINIFNLNAIMRYRFLRVLDEYNLPSS